MITTDSYRIYMTSIPADDRPRRAREEESKLTLLREAFGDTTELSHDRFGAPYLCSHPGTHISLSHSTDTCVLAVSDTPIGVDIENWRPQLSRVAKKFLTPDELERLESLAEESHKTSFLLKMWTAKEATFKASQQSDLVLSEISVSADMAQAEANGTIFDITYPLLTPERVISVSVPLG
ncbi:MAG: 4'-phosphopantetheinyl transferase superfamily protein [Duncaniella sp.]|nr:4'-phosphopantetheinyl transferase superfamily protein [Duncaniella sp.]